MILDLRSLFGNKLPMSILKFLGLAVWLGLSFRVRSRDQLIAVDSLESIWWVCLWE